MAAKATLIIGLPGSGKTYLAKQLQAKSIKTTFLIDDPVHLDISEFDGSRDLIITDPHLCNPVTRGHAVSLLTTLGYEVESIFFENNKEKCMRNIIHRNDGRVMTKEGLKSFKYKIPNLAVVMPIWQPEI